MGRRIFRWAHAHGSCLLRGVLPPKAGESYLTCLSRLFCIDQIQVLIFLSNWELQEERLKRLREQRAHVSAVLQALATPMDVAAAGVVSGAAAAASAETADADAGELVDELAALTRYEEAILLTHAQVDWIIMTDLQRACTMCASFPYPLHAGCIRAAMLHLLRCHADDVFPWAQPPVAAAPADTPP
jgi:hypothetical protein